MRARLLLLGRPDCGLCEDFEAELRTHCGPGRVQLVHEDVDSRPDWQRRYGLKIPVLLTEEGELICSVQFDPEAFEAFFKG